jgi:Zn-dependent protease with chaperone function
VKVNHQRRWLLAVIFTAIAVYSIVQVLKVVWKVSGAAPAQRAELWVVRQQVPVPASKVVNFPFVIPTYVKNGRFVGGVQAYGGSGNDIRVRVFGPPGDRLIYDSGQMRSMVLMVPANEPGQYWVQLDNTFSLFSQKTVNAEIRFLADAPDPDRQRSERAAEEQRVKRVAEILQDLAKALGQYEEQMGTLQVQGRQVRFSISPNAEVNAFAYWEQRVIVLLEGLCRLAESVPDETDNMYASVLGHELAHIFYRDHSGVRDQQAAQSLAAGTAAAVAVNPLVGLVTAAVAFDMNMRHDREQERRADELGVRLMCEAGYASSGAFTFFRKLQERGPSISFLSTHPSPGDRMKNLAALGCQQTGR